MYDSKLLETVTKYAVNYLDALPKKRVFPSAEALESLKHFVIPLPNTTTAPEAILQLLHQSGSTTTVATNGARYFGFVFGGVLPAALAANWLAAAWDQNAVFKITSPIAAQLEKVDASCLLN